MLGAFALMQILETKQRTSKSPYEQHSCVASIRIDATQGRLGHSPE
jgi:hypothetical protein